jgi:hypothetical protein
MSDLIIDAAEEVQTEAREGAELEWVPDVPNAIGL